LGPGPVAEHIEHARGLAASVGPFEGRFLDLGSGGGIPGLVLAVAWPAARASLLDARARACAALEAARADLGLETRIEVVCGRAEALARDADHRERYDLVVARGFGPPAVTAECAVGFLTPGGRLLVTEPPDPDPGRWPATGLARLGLGPARPGPGHVEIRRTGAPIDDWPRPRPARTPLW
jgi:16S rRNA (guanine527-N7)-methyltransferase